MINRRELLRRITLGIAGASVSAGEISDSLAKIKPHYVRESANPTPQTTDGIDLASPSHLIINGVDLGNVINVNMQTTASTIDATMLSDTANAYIIRGNSLVDVEVLVNTATFAPIYRNLESHEVVNVELDIFKFDAYVMGRSLHSSMDSPVVVNLSLEVVGAITII